MSDKTLLISEIRPLSVSAGRRPVVRPQHVFPGDILYSQHVLRRLSIPAAGTGTAVWTGSIDCEYTRREEEVLTVTQVRNRDAVLCKRGRIGGRPDSSQVEQTAGITIGATWAVPSPHRQRGYQRGSP